MSEYILIFVLTFVVACLLSPLILKLLGKIKVKQTILHYVKEHEQKQGTKTMGGLIFICAFLLCFFWFLRGSTTLAVVCAFVTFSYFVMGFLDDFIKIKFKQNLGLKAYQKIIGQVAISFVVALFCYKNFAVGSEMYIPFTTKTINLGVFIIPFIMFVFIAMVNSVNLIDGLDGLCAGVSFVVVLAFSSLILFYTRFLNANIAVEYLNLVKVCFCIAGALIAYYLVNCFPAKVFMGDTGSLALGGLITCVAVFSRLTLYLPIVGIMFVLTALSDVIQVLYYKKTKKRVFLMAPLHHHFQKKGVNENRIVVVYIVITLMISLLSVAVLIF